MNRELKQRRLWGLIPLVAHFFIGLVLLSACGESPAAEPPIADTTPVQSAMTPPEPQPMVQETTPEPEATVASDIQPLAEVVSSEEGAVTMILAGEPGKTPTEPVTKEPPVSESKVTRVAGKIVKLTQDSIEIEDPEGKIHKVIVPEDLRKNIASAQVGDLAGLQMRGQTAIMITAPLPPGESWITEITEDTIILSPEPAYKGFGLKVRMTKDTVVETGFKLEKGVHVHVEFEGDALKYISKIPSGP